MLKKIKFLHNFSRQLYNCVTCVEYFCWLTVYMCGVFFASHCLAIPKYLDINNPSSEVVLLFLFLNWDSGSWMCSLHWFQEGFIQLIRLPSFSLKTKIKCRIHSVVCLGEDKNFPFFWDYVLNLMTVLVLIMENGNYNHLKLHSPTLMR